MKRLIAVFICIINLLILTGCTKENSNSFSIIGKWGMVSGSITNKDGSVNRYGKLGSNIYYQYIEYKVDGTIIKTTEPDKKVSYGDYVYNEASKLLQYKFDGEQYYVNASINVVSSNEMTVTFDYGSAGRIIQYFFKLK